MKVDPGSGPVQGLTVLLHFVVLNVVFLLACLPILTIGAATSALFEVTFRYADEERGRLLRDFFPAFLKNAGRATALAMVLLVPAAAAVFSGLFWASMPTIPAAIAAPLAFLAVVYLFAAFIYAMALTALYRASFRQALRNALLLPAAMPARTLAVLLLPVTAVCLTVLFPPVVLLLVTIAFSLGGYTTALILRGGFARFQVVE